MPVTPWKEAGTAAQVDQPGVAWTNLNDLLSGAAGTNTKGATTDMFHTWKLIQLIKAGSLSGTDKGTPFTSTGTGPSVASYGGSSDLWGNTLTEANVEASNFGIAIQVGRDDTGGSISDRIELTNFGFSIPSGSIPTGVEVQISYERYVVGGGIVGLNITKVEMRVHYNLATQISGEGTSMAAVIVRGIEPVERDKSYRFLAYDSDRNYVGDITKYVVNNPQFKQAINNLHGNMPLELAQNEQSKDVTVDGWVNETPEDIVTDEGEQILFDLAAAVGLGPGSTVEVNNEIDVIAYYGAMHAWVDETGEPIVTDDGEMIAFEDGYPLGRPVFTGYMSQWELYFGDGDNVQANLLSHSKELDNIMLETDDTLDVAHGSVGTSSIGIAGAGPTDYIEIAQQFTYQGSTGARGRMRFKAWPGLITSAPVTIKLYQSNNINALGTAIAEATSFVKADPNDYQGDTFVDFIFDPVTLTNLTEYIVVISSQTSKSGGSSTYPANFYKTTSGVAGGTLYYRGGADIPNWTDSGNDLWFEIYTLGGATTRTFNSQDPGAILRQIADFAALRGARVKWDASTIELTGTTVSLTLKTNTISEAIAAVLKTCPADWYYYYDYGTNMLHLHPRPTEPAHYYTKGRDVVKLKIKRTIEQLKNDVYFSGGGSLMIRKIDQTRINAWRRALVKESDSRVTVQSTAEILSEAIVDQWGEPLYSGEQTIVRVQDFRIEDVTVGELSGYIGFGALVDALNLQNVSVQYNSDHLAIVLDILTPATPKRIEDIKRNLEELAHEDDPTSPTIT